MGGRESNSDEGPKLREEGNYRDFYPTLGNEDQLALLINGESTEVDDIYLNADIQNIKFNQGIPVKQLICNGKINAEPLVIESTDSNCHKCNITIQELDKDTIKTVSKKPITRRKKMSISHNLFDQAEYLTKLDEMQHHQSIEEDSNSLSVLKANLCKIFPHLTYLDDYYDMDEQDVLFLKYLKNLYPNMKMNHLQFELFFTILELEYTILQSHIPKPAPPPAFTDQLCSICNGKETTNNTIVFCDCCNIAVHQDCYGIIFIPPGPWLCRVCLQNNMPSQRPQCIACPEIDGPMKQTTSGNWIHVTCAIWISELNFGNWHYLEPVEGVERIPNLRWKLNCFICKEKMGACIQCSWKNCFTAYHVSCARRVGLKMTPLKTGSLAEMALGNDTELVSYCDKHSIISGKSNGGKNCETRIEQLRNQIDQGKISRTKNLKQDGVIPPHVFADFIFQAILNLGVLNNDDEKAHELSFTICKYWSLKREYNKGAPLFEIDDNIVRYAYNLLEESDIGDKISFIDVIERDLNKIGELVQLTNLRNEKEIELLESKERIRSLLQNTTLSMVRRVFLSDFISIDPFKAISKYLKKNNLDDSFIHKCTNFEFKDINEFETKITEYLQYLKDLNEVSRIISSAIEKLEDSFHNIMKITHGLNIHNLLAQDFVINEDDITSTVERSWGGRILMAEQELSDVEDLSLQELDELDICVYGRYAQMETGSDSTVPEEVRIRKKPGPKPRGKPGPKPRVKPGPKPRQKPGPKPIYLIESMEVTDHIRKKPGPKPRGKPGSNPKGFIDPVERIRRKPDPKPRNRPGPKPRNKPGPKPRLSSDTYEEARFIRKKPGPKPGPKPKILDDISDLGEYVRKKPGPKPRGKPGPKPRGKPGPKPKSSIESNGRVNCIRKKPGPKPRGKPGPKPKMLVDTAQEVNYIRKKPGPKPRAKPGPKPRGKPGPEPKNRTKEAKRNYNDQGSSSQEGITPFRQLRSRTRMPIVLPEAVILP